MQRDQNTTFLFYEIFCLCKQKMGFVYISKNLTFKRLHGFCCPVRLFWSTFQAEQLLFQKFCLCMPQNLDRLGPCSAESQNHKLFLSFQFINSTSENVDSIHEWTETSNL